MGAYPPCNAALAVVNGGWRISPVLATIFASVKKHATYVLLVIQSDTLSPASLRVSNLFVSFQGAISETVLYLSYLACIRGQTLNICQNTTCRMSTNVLEYSIPLRVVSTRYQEPKDNILYQSRLDSVISSIEPVVRMREKYTWREPL